MALLVFIWKLPDRKGAEKRKTCGKRTNDGNSGWLRRGWWPLYASCAATKEKLKSVSNRFSTADLNGQLSGGGHVDWRAFRLTLQIYFHYKILKTAVLYSVTSTEFVMKKYILYVLNCCIDVRRKCSAIYKKLHWCFFVVLFFFYKLLNRPLQQYLIKYCWIFLLARSTCIRLQLKL